MVPGKMCPVPLALPTIFRLMGFNHDQLTYNDAGRDFRLTAVSGHVVGELLT